MTRSRSPTRSRCSSPTCEGSSKPVASLDSSIRSAARATYSAYRRLPIRWRLAGGSAALTLVILCGFAAIVGVLTTRQIHEDFHNEVASSADKLEQEAQLRMVVSNGHVELRPTRNSTDLDDFAASSNAAIRVITEDDLIGYQPPHAPDFGVPSPRTFEFDGWRVENRRVDVIPGDRWWIQYARKVSEVEDTAARVKVFLAFGVLGGALLALLAGLATARRAMEPTTELPEAARETGRGRAPPLKAPTPTPTTRSPSSPARWTRCSPRSTAREPRRRARWPVSASSSPTP